MISTLIEKAPHIYSVTKTPDGENIYIGQIDMFVDHHMLAGYRACESKFMLDHISNLQLRGIGKSWSLDFGIWMHHSLEWYYEQWRQRKCSPDIQEWLLHAKKVWIDTKMDDHGLPTASKTSQKKYESIDGWQGASALLCEYYAFHVNQRYEIIATEISFGRNKEVPLGFFDFNGGNEIDGDIYWRINLYLCGRIDMVVSNGSKIGPVDHKTKSRFDGGEQDDYNPHEGITGYIYAIDKVFKSRDIIGSSGDSINVCRDGWIFHISVSNPPKTGYNTERFKISPIGKTSEQLEFYAQRQIRTAQKMTHSILTGEADWNTGNCHSFFSDCQFIPLHRVANASDAVKVLENAYETKPYWNPEEKGFKP